MDEVGGLLLLPVSGPDSVCRIIIILLIIIIVDIIIAINPGR